MSEQKPQTLAVFLLDTEDAAQAFLKIIQKIDEGDKNVEMVDAATAERTKKGKVKVHQVMSKSHKLRGSTIGVVIGGILLGPAGAVIGGAAGGTLAGVRSRLHDMGINDTFMKQAAGEVEKGKSALFVLYEGAWSASVGAVQDAIRAHNALLIQSTLPPEKVAALTALVASTADELGGEEVVADYEVETEPEEAPAPAAVEAGAEPDDLTRISGVGPKGSEVLVAAGIDSYARLSGSSEPELRKVFQDAHAAVPANIGTWAMQASFAEHGDWAGLKAFVQTTQPAAHPKAAAAPQQEPDDLTNLVGIGPKAAKALAAAGIKDYRALSDASEPQLRKALHDKDLVAPASIGTWPMQADYAVKGDWRGLARYNQKSAKGKASTPRSKAAPAAAVPAAKPDDLTQLAGIGPRIASLLADGGVTTYAALQHLSSEELREIISSGGALPPSSLETWPTQASYAAKGDFNGLATYNARHNA